MFRRTSAIVLMFAQSLCAQTDELPAQITAERIQESINSGRRYLVARQLSDGSFPADGILTHPTAVSSLATIALIHATGDIKSRDVSRALANLRGRTVDATITTHDLSFLLLALVTAREPEDHGKIVVLTQVLQQRQLTTGGWPSTFDSTVEEPVLTQLAILALRDAVHAGISIPSSAWDRAVGYWERIQNSDGSWGMPEPHASIFHPADDDPMLGLTLSTISGIASISICQSMLDEANRVNSDGILDCCRPGGNDLSITLATKWLEREKRQRPFVTKRRSLLTYNLIGVESAARSSFHNIVDEHEWYRNGVTDYLERQDLADGHWHGNNDVVATSHALIFLSKSLVPIAVTNARKAANSNSGMSRSSNRSKAGVEGLLQAVGRRPGWPRMLGEQQLNMTSGEVSAAVNALLRAPVLLINGLDSLPTTDEEVFKLQEYVRRGGFVFGLPGCDGTEFEIGFRQLIDRIFPGENRTLSRLSDDHPIYQMDYSLDPKSVTMYGLTTGCRTCFVYCPDDLVCAWNALMPVSAVSEGDDMARLRIQRAIEIGTNVIAYASGRSPPPRWNAPKIGSPTDNPEFNRRLLQVAQIQHGANWNAAPFAVQNLMHALEETTGNRVSKEVHVCKMSDPQIRKYSVIYMQGSGAFQVSDDEIRSLSQYLTHGGFLFADACGNDSEFDRSFRVMMKRIRREKFEQVPVDHDLFSERIGHSLQRVKRRRAEPARTLNGIGSDYDLTEPFLEAMTVNGRVAMIYSKYDLSCTLSNPTHHSTYGYAPDDAIRIATNVLRFALLQ